MKIGYMSNNSGGGWWLKDEDWKNLESAGWAVNWSDGGWLGSLATSASKEFDSPRDAIVEFQKITNADVLDEGCNCCGPPHSFSWEDGYCSGEDCARELYGIDEVPSTAEMLREKYGDQS